MRGMSLLTACLVAVLLAISTNVAISDIVVPVTESDQTWLRQSNPDTVYDSPASRDNNLSVWSSGYAPTDVRDGLYQFNLSTALSGYSGYTITDAYLELFNNTASTRNVLSFSQAAALVSPAGTVYRTWNGLSNYTQTPLQTLGSYSSASDTNGVWDTTSSASPADLTLLNSAWHGSGFATLLFMASRRCARLGGVRPHNCEQPRRLAQYLWWHRWS